MTITMENRGATFADTGETRQQRDAYYAAIVFAGNTAVGATYAKETVQLAAHYDDAATGQDQFPFGD